MSQISFIPEIQRLFSITEMAAMAGCSARTVRREMERHGIPYRNLQFRRWKPEDGPAQKRIHIHEWMKRDEISTRSLRK